MFFPSSFPFSDMQAVPHSSLDKKSTGHYGMLRPLIAVGGDGLHLTEGSFEYTE